MLELAATLLTWQRGGVAVEDLRRAESRATQALSGHAIARRTARENGVATILIIDDDPDFDEFLTIMLGLEGYSVTSAYDGKTGIAAAKNQNPDLILLDIMMPDVDGYEVCRKLSQTMQRRPPIIFVTARTSESDRKRAVNAGASEYVTKPFEFADLLRRIKAQLGEAGPASAPKEETSG